MRRLSRGAMKDSSADGTAVGDSEMTATAGIAGIAGIADVTDAAERRDIPGSAVRTVAVVVFQVFGAGALASPIEWDTVLPRSVPASSPSNGRAA
jgi:hypothetical protein